MRLLVKYILLCKVMLLFYFLSCAGAGELPNCAVQLDALFGDRRDMSGVKPAAEECQVLLDKNTPGINQYEVLWRLSMAYFHLGRELPNNDAGQKLEYYEKAIDAGKRAVEVENDRVEGHYWHGLSLAARGEVTGVFKVVKSLGTVKREMHIVEKLDDKYEEGGAYRALGRLAHKLPRILGGSKTKSLEYYKKSLAISPNNPYTHYFLAELLLDEGKKEEGRKELELILNMSEDNNRGYDVMRNKIKARKLYEERFGRGKGK